jgi:hypothetical protein
MLSARSSAVRGRLGNDDKVSIDYIEACGDCFYLAIESALSEICGWQPYYAVATQRQLVASQMSEETFQLYSLLYAQQAEGAAHPKRAWSGCGQRVIMAGDVIHLKRLLQPARPAFLLPPVPPRAHTRPGPLSARHLVPSPGFGFMRGIESLEQLRRRVLLRGKQVGAHRCVWADGFAMEVIANHFGVLLLIMDERFNESSMFTRITPRRHGAAGQDQGDSSTLDALQSTVRRRRWEPKLLTPRPCRIPFPAAPIS